jgi:hypothetical protein
MTVMDLPERQVSYWVDSDKVRGRRLTVPGATDSVRYPGGRRDFRRAVPAGYCSRLAPIVIFIGPASLLRCRP